MKERFKIKRMDGGQYAIINDNYNVVFGGDCLNEDHYNIDYISDIFNHWDGSLNEENCIDVNNINTTIKHMTYKIYENGYKVPGEPGLFHSVLKGAKNSSDVFEFLRQNKPARVGVGINGFERTNNGRAKCSLGDSTYMTYLPDWEW